ncbi:hypothetical protein MTR67_044661 [Solanum verrucosum]|uniref:Serine hydroxymethyltransferase-like domain-containing protein n=1 Tax=Solanum verrucosum TaxID=315347 RepID=A0AAF0UTT6_SOLVR|nr:hypothetical protein MTR67_044661 [Solanum verrucosum]
MGTPKLVVTNANDFARQFNYTRLGKVCNKQEFFLLADKAYISGLVASEVMCSPFEPAVAVTFATQFMTIFYVVSRLVGVAGSIQDHILYFANIGQFVLATGRECAPTNIVLDSNLEDESIVMNQAQPNVDTRVMKVVIGLTRAIGQRTSNRARLIWDPG